MTHRVILLGSPDFALPSVQSLVDDPRFDVGLVVSQPDRPSGRGRVMRPPPVAAYAQEAGLPVIQPQSLKDEEAVSVLQDLTPDLLVVVAYGEILTNRVLRLARGGALNVHPSLLPKYRGASPVNAAILHGDATTGVSIIKLVRRLDAGPVVATRESPVEPGDTAGSLGQRLSTIAAEMLPDVCGSWLSGELDAVPQNEDLASYTREWSKDDARIDWQMPALHIERLIRASLPWPVAWTVLDGQRIQIRAAYVHGEPSQRGADPGTVARQGRDVVVATGSGSLRLLAVQPEGKSETSALGWWNGLRSPGEWRFR